MLVLSNRSQFFHKRLFLSCQAKLRSTIQRFGVTLKVCSSLRLATCAHIMHNVIRLRKRYLKEHEMKRARREGGA